MTKEEKIKEAWAGFFNPQVNMENGWMDIRPGTYSNDEFFDRLKFNSEKHSIRPKSLQGIESNKGWFKVESENDLPEYDNENVRYRTGMFLNDGRFHQDSNLCTHKIAIECLKWNYTHYQIINQSEPPIY